MATVVRQVSSVDVVAFFKSVRDKDAYRNEELGYHHRMRLPSYLWLAGWLLALALFAIGVSYGQ